MMTKQVAVIGSGGDISPSVESMAEELGKRIGQKGAVLISGGRGGVMEASCRGVKKEKGLVVGILPRTRTQANQYVDIAIVTGMGDARNVLNVNSADVVISVSGGSGTLSEIGLALKAGKSVIVLSKSGGVSSLLAGKIIDGKSVISAETIDEAIKIAFE
jgi:uncharacterized protein (TIGR00725 family)